MYFVVQYKHGKRRTSSHSTARTTFTVLYYTKPNFGVSNADVVFNATETTFFLYVGLFQKIVSNKNLKTLLVCLDKYIRL